jgi:L-histidine N-alpha-methyltransferase
MLTAERSPLSIEVATELRDALSRRQKELPARWLAALDATTLSDGTGSLPSHEHEAIEYELALHLVRDKLANARPRGVVCVRPSASAASLTVADVLCRRGSVTSIAAAELDSKLAVEMLERVASRDICDSSAAVACDCTVELPLPDNFPRPRIYLCLGNTLGSVTAVGAVRLLRILRTTMTPTDSIVLGLEASHAKSTAELSDARLEAEASRHLRALSLINSTVGAGFDLSRFDYRSSYDPEARRLETHLVARKALDVDVPGICTVRFRKGESIRTSVSCVFDRNRVTAMMAGVGLSLADWTPDTTNRYVVALATPAI